MHKRYFLRRCLAYFLDSLIAAILVTVIVIGLNMVVSDRILAPEFIKTNTCQNRVNLVSPERMNEILPLEAGQNHAQIICFHQNMFSNSFFTTQLIKFWSVDNTNYNTSITYYSDAEGNQANYIPTDPFLYLFSPLLFAYFLTKWGKTPGKRILGLHVINDQNLKPGFGPAIKREYLKAIIFVVGAIFSLYGMWTSMFFTLDELASQTRLIEAAMTQEYFWLTFLAAMTIFAACFWFMLGSFIKWRGRTYWDRFANLNTVAADNSSLEEPNSP